MREILFRGFTPYENGKEKVFVKNKWITGKWVVGSYMKLDKTTYCVKEDYEKFPDNTEHYIVFDEMTDWGLPNRHLQADVIPETVRQYTGLCDKNGKKIFEGDILSKFSNYAGKKIIKPVVFELGIFFWKFSDSAAEPLYDVRDRAEIIGNIFENPELLEVEE